MITDVPLPVNVKFGALVDEPPVVPKVTVLVIDASVVKPPVPVYVKPVAVANDNTTVAAVVCANTILPVPKLIARVAVPVLANIPVVKLNPFNANVPVVMVVVPVATKDSASPSVVVPDVLFIVNAAIVLVLLVIVPVPTIVAVSAVNVPPVLNVRLFKFNVVAAMVNAVVPKFSVLK